MSNWKNLLTKYLIEFVVIVLGITTSYFVESFRDEQWESKREIQLLGELKIEFEDQLKQLNKRRIFFSKDYRIINFITSSRTDFKALKEDVKRPSQIKTALFDMRYFSPPRDIYNSIVSEGLFKYIQSNRLKILLNKLYQTDYEYIMGNISSEGIYLDNIIFYLTENHPRFYNQIASKKDISLEKLIRIVQKIRKDEVLISKLQFKENKMRIKLYLLDDYLTQVQQIQEEITQSGF
ncbi:MAG: hypothetical protein ACPHL7_00110 [Flavobacteriaceae bacterium]